MTGSRHTPFVAMSRAAITLIGVVCIASGVAVPRAEGATPAAGAAQSSVQGPLFGQQSPQALEKALGQDPASLRAAVEKDLGSRHENGINPMTMHLGAYGASHQLAATYSPDGAKLSGHAFSVNVGRSTVGRGNQAQTISSALATGTWKA